MGKKRHPCGFQFFPSERGGGRGEGGRKRGPISIVLRPILDRTSGLKERLGDSSTIAFASEGGGGEESRSNCDQIVFGNIRGPEKKGEKGKKNKVFRYEKMEKEEGDFSSVLKGETRDVEIAITRGGKVKKR